MSDAQWELFQRLAWTQLWQISLLFAVVVVLSRTWLRHRPRAIHLLWMITFVKSLTPPLCGSRFSFFSWCQVEIAQAESLGSRAFGSASSEWFVQHIGTSTMQLLAFVWICGGLLKLVVTAGRALALKRALTLERIPTPPAVDEAFAVVSTQLNVRRVDIRVTNSDIGPAIFGYWRRTWVLPIAVGGDKGAGQIEPIIAHELVHVRRGDTAASILSLLVDTVWWFHPLAWWGTRESSYQCERCADAEVLALLDYPPSYYAHCLLSVLETKCKLHPIVGAAGMNAMEITEQRIRSIMTTRPRPRRWPEWVAAVCLGVLLIPGGSLTIDGETLIPCHTFRPDLPSDYRCWSAEDLPGATPEAFHD